ncbi:MAG TPA: hypothetical protein VFN74_05185 [Chloroflexota bacterium]|nr:hypothetical protein [Chloroflexota bacterium]
MTQSHQSAVPSDPANTHLTNTNGNLGGPKTAKGKAASSQNSLAHGIMSTRPLVPGVEHADEWEAHRRGFFETYKPVGHPEETCVFHIAQLHWRLNRITRFETEEIALAQEAAEEEAFQLVREQRQSSHEHLSPHILCLPDDLDALRERLAMARLTTETLTSLSHVPGNHTIPDDAANATLLITADSKSRQRAHIPTREPRDRWTASFLREALGSLAPNAPLNDLIQTVMRFARDTAGAIERALAHTERLATRLRRQRILPAVGVTDRVARYESHLTRQVVAYTRELENLIAIRTGAPISKAQLHVTGLPEAV